MSNATSKTRVLVIDDSEAIHTDFRRLFSTEQRKGSDELDELEAALFGPTPARAGARDESDLEVDSAFQGQEGVAKVREAIAEGRPYSLVFLDYRMPPGWNGAETLRHLRKVAPTLRVVLCSAYSDYSWGSLIQEFGESELLREMRKPFNGQELRQLVLSLTAPRG